STPYSLPTATLTGHASLFALLAEATSDQLYFQAAVESWKFIQAHLLNDQNLVFEAIYAPQNYSCAIIRETQPYNTGIVIEGLSILVALTNDTETKNVCVFHVLSYPPCN
ncbi:hypothetical protein B0H19DRAFT_965716, partial [Mycena capillaripes]